MQDHSEKRLREKLRLRGYEADEIDEAVRRLTEKRYLDDEAVCARACRRMMEESALSARQIVQTLMRRGFSGAAIAAAMPDGAERDERELSAAAAALRARFRAAAPREKMKRFLYRRGFGCGACEAAVRAFLAEYPEFATEESDGYEE